MNNKLTNSIIDRIEQDKIQPRSKWYYRLRYGGFWGLFGLMLLLGALSFAVMLYAITHTDFEIFEYVGNDAWLQLLSLMPFVWVLLVGIAIGLGIWGLRHTKRGYRFALAMILGGNVLGSVLIGSLVYGSGGAEFIEEIVEEKVPVYESVREKHERFWGQPEKTGRLAGMVESIDAETGLVKIMGPRGRSWEIPKTRLDKFGIDIQVGEPLKMKGTIEGKAGFMPERMRPAQRQERMQKRIKKRFERNPELRKARQQLKEAGERLRREILPPQKRPFRGNQEAAGVRELVR